MGRKSLRLYVLGRQWKFSVISADAFVRRFKEESAGVTVPDSLEVVINEEEFTLQTVDHEIWHIAMDSMCISSARLSTEQFEEVTAEVHAVYGDTLRKLGKLIYSHFKD